jgi:hypothetical protein
VDDVDVIQEVRRVLAAPLCELVDGSVASIGDSLVMNQWAIRDEGKAALAASGVPIERGEPDDVHLEGAVQDSVNLELFVSGSHGYRLGYDSQWTLAAMTPSSEVWAVDLSSMPDLSTGAEIIRVRL